MSFSSWIRFGLRARIKSYFVIRRKPDEKDGMHRYI